MWPHRTGESPFLERRLTNHVLLGPEMGQASIVEGPEETATARRLEVWITAGRRR